MHSLKVVIGSKKVDLSFLTQKKLYKKIMAEGMRDTEVMRSVKVKIMVLIKKVASDMSRGQVNSIKGVEITLIRRAGIALIGGDEVNKGVVQESQDLGKEGPKSLEVGLRTR